MADHFLRDVLVVETGDRVATGLCGGLLQRLGAEVVVLRPFSASVSADAKWRHREMLGAGKSELVLDAPLAQCPALLAAADVVITCSDWSEGLAPELADIVARVPIVCDVSAFGLSADTMAARYTDAMMQAFAGLMDCTGMADGEPVRTHLPITECCAAVYAASGVVAAMLHRRRDSRPQRVEIAMFDTAFSLLSTFLPKHFVGEAPRRMGNRHPSMSPWNAFRARDGWILLCSASDDMWGRVCGVIGRPELSREPRFATMAGRVANAEAADAAIEPWAAAHSVDECMAALNAAAVPCGPVSTIDDLLRDETLRSRGAVCAMAGAAAGLLVPGGLIHGAPAAAQAPERPLQPYEHRQRAGKVAPVAAASLPNAAGAALLENVRVLEMGSYTTAPLAARHLGALGADVIKLEPPSGELSRASPPHSAGQSFFCTLSNSDKRCVVIDLKHPADRETFRELLKRADVFVENMKPGVLARFGFGPSHIADINPRIVYCSVSGYGASTALSSRPAMDTTIQGVAAVMDLTRSLGAPFKTGVSISDILGGQFALLAILAALECRERSGRGDYIDLSMHELSAWLTQFEWNARTATGGDRLIECDDGYLYVSDAAGPAASPGVKSGRTRAEVAAELAAQGVVAVPVHTVREVALLAHTKNRELIVMRPDPHGKPWPLLSCPIRLSPVPARVACAIGAPGADTERVLRDWGVSRNSVGHA